MKQFGQFVVIHSDTETNDRREEVAHVISILHFNDCGFHSVSLLLNVLALEIRLQGRNVNRTQFSVGRD